LAKYRVVVDRQTCIGCGVAPAVCSDVFILDENTGKNMVVEKYAVETTNEVSIGIVPEELYECVKKSRGSLSCRSNKNRRSKRVVVMH